MLGIVYFIQGKKLGRGDCETLNISGCIIADSCADAGCDGVWGWRGRSNTYADAYACNYGYPETNRHAQTYGYTKTNGYA